MSGSIEAHTNAVGYYSHTSDRVVRKHGIDFFRPFDGSRTFSVVDAISDKSGTIQSDHKLPTYYRRRISRMTETPGETHYVLRNSIGQTLDDYRETRWLSESYSAVSDFPFPPAAQLAEENSRDRANVECLLKLQEFKGELAVDLIEAKKTVSMLANAAKDVVDGFLNFRRGIPRAMLVRWSKDPKNYAGISNKWLEYQYGWKPLYSSLHDIAQAAFSDLRKDLLIHAKRTINWKAENLVPKVERNRVLTESRFSGGTKVHILARVDVPWVRQASSLGLVNPLSIAWELQPYSFVVDWFAPIGNVLNAVTAVSGLQFVWGYQTHQRNVNIAKTFTADAFAPQSLEPNASLIERHFEFERRVLYGYPIPRLYAKDHPFSATHIANAAALVRGIVGGKYG